ncbi:hypothetical protein PV04_01656 [Phialophora macrospora]|uniref:Uncharacterized protein n=1 Tax=Phialophora macrospora TaxID=1851006 RepID=A0A0D2GMF5_9EURO|nr:hypothetical protein PV04_01656 [Phialophora macrospora]
MALHAARGYLMQCSPKQQQTTVPGHGERQSRRGPKKQSDGQDEARPRLAITSAAPMGRRSHGWKAAPGRSKRRTTASSGPHICAHQTLASNGQDLRFSAGFRKR